MGILDSFLGTAMAIKPGTALLNMLFALVLSMVMFFVYKRSFAGVAYSRKFNITLVMLALITTVVMNILGNSLALSMGMVGALSIVRFRTAIKDPRDTAYIFWAITIGLGCGSSNYFMALVGSVVIAIVAFLFSRKSQGDESFLLVVRCSDVAAEAVRAKVKGLYALSRVRGETMTDDYVELVYQVKLKGKSLGANEQIKAINGVYTVNMVARNGETLG